MVLSDSPRDAAENLWERYSQEDLWQLIHQQMEATTIVRLLMLLARHRDQPVALQTLQEECRPNPARIASWLQEWLDQGILVQEGEQLKIADRKVFLELLHYVFGRAAVSASRIAMLADWGEDDPVELPSRPSIDG